jgi:hypothetical protein
MSKKIEKALDELVKALRHHARVSGARTTSLKKSERAVLQVQEAMERYAAVVEAKTGMDRAFIPVSSSWLDARTMESLIAERNALAARSIESLEEKFAQS